jgi:hypothetical protein
MKALSLTIQKIWPILKFLQTDKQTDRPKTIHGITIGLNYHELINFNKSRVPSANDYNEKYSLI